MHSAGIDLAMDRLALRVKRPTQAVAGDGGDRKRMWGDAQGDDLLAIQRDDDGNRFERRARVAGDDGDDLIWIERACAADLAGCVDADDQPCGIWR